MAGMVAAPKYATRYKKDYLLMQKKKTKMLSLPKEVQQEEEVSLEKVSAVEKEEELSAD